jgi:hypothetical protein
MRESSTGEIKPEPSTGKIEERRRSRNVFSRSIGASSPNIDSSIPIRYTVPYPTTNCFIKEAIQFERNRYTVQLYWNG